MSKTVSQQIREEREVRTGRLRRAAAILSDSANFFHDVQYHEGGHMEFDPNRGEVMAPHCISFRVSDMGMGEFQELSMICDELKLRVVVPDHKQRSGMDKFVRLVPDRDL